MSREYHRPVWDSRCYVDRRRSLPMKSNHQKQRQSRPENGKNAERLDPEIIDHGAPIQRFGTVRDLPISLPAEARKQSVDLLNEIVADTMTLRDLYKKC